MKQFTSILLAITILFLNIGFSISNHYCEGELSGIAVTLGNKDLGCEMEDASQSNMDMQGSCGMSDMDSSCEVPEQESTTLHNDCCQNEYFPLKIDDNFEKQSILDINVDFKFFAAYIISYANLFSANNLKSKAHLAYAPPWLLQDVQILLQSFLL